MDRQIDLHERPPDLSRRRGALQDHANRRSGGRVDVDGEGRRREGGRHGRASVPRRREESPPYCRVPAARHPHPLDIFVERRSHDRNPQAPSQRRCHQEHRPEEGVEEEDTWSLWKRAQTDGCVRRRSQLAVLRRRRSTNTRRSCSAKMGVCSTRKRNRPSLTATTRQSLCATADALRGCLSINAISPNTPPAPTHSRRRSFFLMSTSPSSTANMCLPGSPSLKIVWPAANVRTSGSPLSCSNGDIADLFGPF